MAFYDYRTPEPTSDLSEIESNAVMFSQAVRLFEEDTWAALGARPLEGDVAKPVVNFMQDLGNFRDCVIFDTTGMERQVSPKECIGIERAASWDANHIEDRLLDRFMGRPNAAEIRSRVRLK